MGEIQLGASNYEQVLKQDPDNLEACVYLAQARKEVSSSPQPVLLCQAITDSSGRIQAIPTSHI